VTAFTQRLYQHFPGKIEHVALFGSKARGDSRPWSDIDILIITDNGDWRFQHAISNLASRISTVEQTSHIDKNNGNVQKICN
jgi:predicted nucleotidyltransferase